MSKEHGIKLYALTLDCKDPHELAKFYAALLQWEIPFYDEEYACVGAPGAAQGAYPGITFQRNSEYKPPCGRPSLARSSKWRTWISQYMI